ncbi:TetR family transcriptional regulator C-terminal domain-containing protein [Kaustia mangrovi]|uniref:TetR family transcriptional regulator C-terminal domain-containing protein n=1 Tax=Kaustia mangrovi TaxID=2593653 RepID=A0A7S8C142_9HYPH|nr:TetR family transcriptional regulator C-terminal domain-containing protein [Kaustia mangrovi]QPC41449.1 TetR family transcriptional regulator C-terminal domain-containing protein [Kaustia mangrovi]
MNQRRSFSREEPEIRRRALIEALLRCLAKHGHARSSVRTIAAEADVSPGLIRHHFGEKNQLVVAAYRYLSDQLFNHISAALDACPPDPRARLRAFVKARFTAPVVSRDYVTAWLVLWGVAMTDPDIRTVHREVDEQYRELTGHLLRDIIGEARDTREIGPLTREFTALLNGLWLEWSLSADGLDPDVLSDMSLNFIDRTAVRELT